MRPKKSYMNPESFDISVEEFDVLEGKHNFSEEYKKNKKNMMKEFRKRNLTRTKISYAKIAAAVSLVIVSVPVVANAATNGELFNRIWGSFGKENIASHDEVMYDELKGEYTVTYPQREYEDIDPEKAEELIGDNISYEPIVQQIGDTKLTILSYVVDGNAAVVEFTLEKEGGVDALHYSQLDNEARGAMFSEDATFDFYFKGCGENIYVDLDKSTSDKLYCYDYMVLWAAEGLTLKICEYPCTIGEMYEADKSTRESIKEDTKVSLITLPVKSEVETVEYVNCDGGSLVISPLSIKIDMENGLGLTEKEAYDPYNAYYIAINYKDGSQYIVAEHEKRGEHTCEVEIYNAGYACGSLDNHLTYVFNRLVDVENIESITINESIYTAK